jgi:hypothetical protein
MRNTTLDPKVRSAAMLKLNAFPKEVRSLVPPLFHCRTDTNATPQARPTSVKNRCVETGRGGGVFSEFGLCRVRLYSFLVLPTPSKRGDKRKDEVLTFSLFCFFSSHSIASSSLPKLATFLASPGLPGRPLRLIPHSPQHPRRTPSGLFVTKVAFPSSHSALLAATLTDVGL